MSQEITLLTKKWEKTLNCKNLFLQLKVSDANNYKTQSIDPNSFEMQSLSCCYNIQAEIRKDDSQFGLPIDPIHKFGKKFNVILDMPSQKLLFCWLTQFWESMYRKNSNEALKLAINHACTLDIKELKGPNHNMNTFKYLSEFCVCVTLNTLARSN